ncbi:glycosyltransferase family 4 protein [Salinibacter ruber]|uniref:Glycosyltransferase involved in cell wall biosynthesis n=1 Tax=Salinibacter ruber TaxID=146919 RepID=A0A9X2V8N5_9BACT|nr:glycosyltransferase family 4 protein [Salinibacter ruber]MCS4122718.1 glycosyltransferase involved in cell wall biosynthesis [Salinibacter ruber]
MEQRVCAEWTAASVVLVNSEWSKQALQQEGVSEEKIAVVPCAYEPLSDVEARVPSTTGPLRVLWVGTVGLRKGIQYLLEAADLVDDGAMEFTVAGPLSITEHVRQHAPGSVTFLGPVSRDRVSDLYRRADVFVLPTLSDGFALAQLEALAHGVPVVTTRRCGRVVTDGEDGCLVPPRDSEALANALRTLDVNRVQLREMAQAARETSQSYTLDTYAKRLQMALRAADAYSSGAHSSGAHS